MPHKIKLKLLCSSCMFNVSHYQYRQGQPLNCIKFKSGWQSYFFTLYHWVKTYSKSEQFLWIAKLFCFFSALAFPPPPYNLLLYRCGDLSEDSSPSLDNTKSNKSCRWMPEFGVKNQCEYAVSVVSTRNQSPDEAV